MDKQRILVVSPALSVGGVQKAALEMALLLRDSGFEVAICLLLKQAHFFELPADIPCFEPQQEASGTWARMQQMQAMVKNSCAEFGATTVVVYGRYYSAWAAWALKGTGMKLVVSDRNSPLFVLPLWQRIWIRWAFFVKTPVMALAQTQAAKEAQQRYFGKNTQVVLFPNLLDEIKGDEIPREREKIVLAVGRVTDHLKGLDWLFMVRSLVKNKEWKWVIAGGTAEENPALFHELKALDLEGKITFLGKVKDLSEWYKKAGIFVMTSKSEGFPNAMAEAMQYGMPCVAYNFVGGAKDLISSNELGILVEYGNHHACAEALEELMLNDQKRMAMGHAASESVQRLLRKNRLEEVKLLFENL